jgi:hypothetical protein
VPLSDRRAPPPRRVADKPERSHRFQHCRSRERERERERERGREGAEHHQIPQNEGASTAASFQFWEGHC